MRPGFVGIVLSQSEKRESPRDKARDDTGSSGYEEEEADAEKPDSYRRRQACRDQAFAKKVLCTPCEQIEERRVKIGAAENCRPGTLEIRQTTKIGSKEFVEPKTFPA